MNEQKIQKKIIDWLQANGYWVFKTITCNRSGIMDIIACTPWGQFLGIEVKYGANKTSKLQDYNIAEVLQRGGIAFVAYSLEEVKSHLHDVARLNLKYLSTEQQKQPRPTLPPLL